MAKRPNSVNLKRRNPKLCHTTTRGIGWHVNFRDTQTGIAKKHRFEIETEAEAKVAYTKWLVRHLAGDDGACEARPAPLNPVRDPSSSRCPRTQRRGRNHGRHGQAVQAGADRLEAP